MFNKAFVLDAGERAVRTAAQALLALQTVDGTSTRFTTDFKTMAAVALAAAFYSVLTSIVASGTGHSHSASLVDSKIKELQG